ncbi:hypothetical protein ABZP36_021315 [Zizania latifolia]
MLTMYPRLAVGGGAARAAAEEEEDDERHVVCYTFAAACVSLVLLFVLLAVVSVGRACVITGVVVLLFVLSVWFAPSVGAGGAARGRATTAPAPAPAPAVRLTLRGCACGIGDAAIAKLPTFAYERPAATADDEGSGNGKPRGSSLLCAVCLEDVRAGDTVRQLPACGHLFHAPCIDVWLRTRRTCPLCRCDLVSPQKAKAKAAPAQTTASPADALPPV